MHYITEKLDYKRALEREKGSRRKSKLWDELKNKIDRLRSIIKQFKKKYSRNHKWKYIKVFYY